MIRKAYFSICLSKIYVSGNRFQFHLNQIELFSAKAQNLYELGSYETTQEKLKRITCKIFTRTF